jgi:hypothetical protein
MSAQMLAQHKHNSLHRIIDTTKDEYGYINYQGDTVIPMGKYLFCFTEKFDNFAIVSTYHDGIIGIDRNEKILFNVYVFDNGPDYPSNGLFRIIKNGKIGYADERGNVVIEPQFDCAYPFRKGKAKVGKGCGKQTDGEHSWWTGGNWFTINKKGRIIKS